MPTRWQAVTTAPTPATSPSSLQCSNNGPNSSKQTQAVNVYYASVPIDPSKTVQYVVLPDVTANGETAQVTALHVFSIAISG